MAESTATAARTKKRSSDRFMGTLILRVFHLRNRPGEHPGLGLLRGRLAALWNRIDQHGLGVNGLPSIREGQLVIILEHDSLGGTSVLAETTEDAAQHVDLIGAGIAFAG